MIRFFGLLHRFPGVIVLAVVFLLSGCTSSYITFAEGDDFSSELVITKMTVFSRIARESTCAQRVAVGTHRAVGIFNKKSRWYINRSIVRRNVHGECYGPVFASAVGHSGDMRVMCPGNISMGWICQDSYDDSFFYTYVNGMKWRLKSNFGNISIQSKEVITP